MKNLKITSLVLLLAVLFMMPSMADAQRRNNDDAYSNQHQGNYNQQRGRHQAQKGQNRNGYMQNRSHYGARRPNAPRPPMYSRRSHHRMMMHRHMAHMRHARHRASCRR